MIGSSRSCVGGSHAHALWRRGYSAVQAQAEQSNVMHVVRREVSLWLSRQRLAGTRAHLVASCSRQHIIFHRPKCGSTMITHAPSEGPPSVQGRPILVVPMAIQTSNAPADRAESSATKAITMLGRSQLGL